MKPETVQLARDLLRHTLHGPPPLETTMALAEAVDSAATRDTLRLLEIERQGKRIEALAADLAALRIEHEAVRGLLTHTRKDRDEARLERDDYRFVAERVDVLLDAAGVGRAAGPESSQFERSVAALVRERDEALARVESEHQGCNRFAEAMRAELKAVKAERDELRAALSREEHAHGHTIGQRDNAEEWADTLANQIASAAGHEIGEHSNLNNPWDNAQDGLVRLVQARDELRAALSLIRSGAGPHDDWSDEVREGWRRADTALAGGKS